MIRLKRTTKQMILVVAISIVLCLLIFGVVSFFSVKQIKESYKAKLDEVNSIIQENQYYSYVAKEDIKAGDQISKEVVVKELVLSSSSEASGITEDDIGKLALIDINASDQILKNMITESKMNDDLREEEFNVFYLSSNLKEDDYVDVRIVYPNGEDFSVLSKKQLKDISLEYNNCFMWLDTEEILRVSGAIVDSYLHEGSKLYTVKYIEPLIQDGTKITYNPPSEVINLINTDPNIVKKAADNLSSQVRDALDGRLSEFYQNYSGEVSWKDSKDSGLTPSKDEDENSTGLEVQDESEEDVYYVD